MEDHVKNVVVKGYGVVVLRGEEEVLLVRHLEKAGHVTGVYGLPAGRAIEGESKVETAMRELFEETGLKVDVSDLKLLPNIYTADIKRSDGSTKRMSIECFLAVKTSGLSETSSDGETMPEWIAINELSNFNLLPNVDKLVADAIEVRRGLQV